MKIIAISLLIFFSLFLQAATCFSIKTEVGNFTPVAPGVTAREEIEQCQLKELPITFLGTNFAYIGCYKYKKDTLRRYKYLKKAGFHFKNEEIVEHNITKNDPYLLFPYFPHYLKKKIYSLKTRYKQVLHQNRITNIIQEIPQTFSGNKYALEPIINFPLVPIRNLYPYYLHNKKMKILVLYQGVYNLETLYKLIRNRNILEKRGKKDYLLKIPLYISPNATLVINGKNLLLQTKPNPTFVIYHGKLYIADSNVVAWDSIKNQEHKREHITEEDLLMVGKQEPVPYFLGLANSYSLFFNSRFSKLGFHDSIATFGIGLLHYPTPIFRISIFKNYLSKLHHPTGKFIGNTIFDNTMGFYTNNASNVTLLGNLFYNNLIYNVDPHDYSLHLTIARNILIGAYHAHGVVISRGVDNSIIAQNIAFKNHSDGIMLDRDCKYNLVFDNFSFENGYMGISFQESDKNIISSNILFRNHIDGIISRNSLNVLIENNFIKKNGRNGIEVLNMNIDDTLYRDFARDPYHKATSSVLYHNTIQNNFGSGVMVKNSAAIFLQKNSISQNIENYGEDLLPFTAKIIDNPKRFKLYGIGNPFNTLSIDRLKLKKTIFHSAKEQFKELSNYNENFEVVLAQFYEAFNRKKIADAQTIRAITNRVANALYRYALNQMNITDKNKTKLIISTSYIIEAAILGDSEAKVITYYLPYIFWVSKEDIDKSFLIAKKRMQEGLLLEKELYKSFFACSPSPLSQKFVKSNINLFLFAMKFNGIDSFYEWSKQKSYQVNNFPPTNIQTIKEGIGKANMPKIRYYRYLHKKSIAMAKDKRCKKYLNKMAFVSEQVNYIMQKDYKKDLEFIKKQLKRYLPMVNEYRSKKITESQLLKFLGE